MRRTRRRGIQSKKVNEGGGFKLKQSTRCTLSAARQRQEGSFEAYAGSENEAKLENAEECVDPLLKLNTPKLLSITRLSHRFGFE